MKTSFHHLQQKKQLASQLSRLCSLEIGGVRVKGGCGNKNIFIFKGIPASATPVESVNSHKPNKQKDVEKSASFFVLYGIAKLVWICNVKQKMTSHRLLRVLVCMAPRERNGKALSGADFSLRSSQSELH